MGVEVNRLARSLSALRLSAKRQEVSAIRRSKISATCRHASVIRQSARNHYLRGGCIPPLSHAVNQS